MSGQDKPRDIEGTQKHSFRCSIPRREPQCQGCWGKSSFLAEDGVMRPCLISSRRWGYEADTIFIDLSIIALCCLSCHRKAPWLSYFKPSVPLGRGTWKILKKRLSAHLTPPPPGQQTACSHAIYSSIKLKSLFNTRLFIMDLTWYVNI